MISLPSLMVGAASGFVVGCFVGCGAMALRHVHRIGVIEGQYRADVRALAMRVSELVQPSIGTPHQRETYKLAADLWRRHDGGYQNGKP